MVSKFRGVLMVMLILPLLLSMVACMEDEEGDGVEAETSVVAYPEDLEGDEEETVPAPAGSELTFDLLIVDGEFDTEEEFVVPAGEDITLNVTNEGEEEYGMIVGDDVTVHEIFPGNITHVVIEAPGEVGTEFEAKLLAADEDPIEENVIDTVTFVTADELEVEEGD